MEKIKDNLEWLKVSQLSVGMNIAVPKAERSTVHGGILPDESDLELGEGDIMWDEIVEIKKVGEEQVYDIEVEGTHNFVAGHLIDSNTKEKLSEQEEKEYLNNNNEDKKDVFYGAIFAHNTYISGNLGIGNTVPTYKLEVAGDTLASSSYLTGVLTVSGTASSSFAGGLTVAGDFNVNSGKLYVDASSGKVGIGMDTGSSVPSKRLEMRVATGDGIRITSSANTDYYADLLMNYNDATTFQLTLQGVAILTAGSTDNTTIVSKGTNKNIVLTPNGTGYTILNGNVGIGTTSPGALLQIANRFKFNSDGTAFWGTTPVQGELSWDTGKAIVMGMTNNALSLGANGTPDMMYIKTDGKVGIGTTNPGAALDVVGIVRSNSTYGFSMGAIADVARIQYGSDGAGIYSFLTAGNAYAGLSALTVTQANAKSCSLVADSNGLIACTSSSARYKQDIRDLNLNTANLLQLQPRIFKWKESSNFWTPDNPDNVGLIAEEVELLMPELVRYKDGVAESVKYENIPVYLLALAKEQQKNLDEINKILSVDSIGNVGINATASVSQDLYVGNKLYVDGMDIKDEIEKIKLSLNAQGTTGAIVTTSNPILPSSEFMASVFQGLKNAGIDVVDNIVKIAQLMVKTLVVEKNVDQKQSSIGEGIIKANETSVIIESSQVLPSSKIFVTFRTDYGSRWWIGYQENGRFIINIAEPMTDDVRFDWWIVQTEPITTTTETTTTPTPVETPAEIIPTPTPTETIPTSENGTPTDSVETDTAPVETTVEPATITPETTMP